VDFAIVTSSEASKEVPQRGSFVRLLRRKKKKQHLSVKILLKITFKTK